MQAPGVTIPAKQTSVLTATGKTRASLVLRNVQAIEAVATPAKVTNTLPGLLDDKTLACRTRLGSNSSRFDVKLGSAPQASLVAPCITASTLRLNNVGGQCLQVWRPQAKQVDISGGRNVEVVFDPRSLPSRINLNNMTARGDDDVYVSLQFSTLKEHGDGIKPGAITVSSLVPYPSLTSARLYVLLTGCGVNKVTVDVKDGAFLYQVLNLCQGQEKDALADLREVRTAQPCSGSK